MASKRPKKSREVQPLPPTRPTDDGSPQAEKTRLPSGKDMERLRRANTVLPGQDALPSYRPDPGFEP